MIRGGTSASRTGRLFFNGLLVALCLAADGAAAECRNSTAALDSMTGAELVLNGPGGRALTMAVRVADDGRERAGGFQHICPETVQATAIFFRFGSPRRPSFHMHNVKAPLDIAFIDETGLIIDIQRMKPYVLGAAEYPHYRPPARVAAALETRAGYFAQQQITAGNWKIELLER